MNVFLYSQKIPIRYLFIIMNKQTLFLLLLLGLIYIHTLSYKEKLKSQYTYMLEECDSITERYAYMKDALLFQLSMQQNSNIILQNCEWIDEINLDSVFLIYCYPEMICQSCLDSDLTLISEWEKVVGKGSVLILPSISSNRNSKIKAKSLLRHFNYSLLSDSLLKIPKNDEGIQCRYFALLDKKKRIKEIYFPNEDLKITSFYLQSLVGNIPE